MWYVIQTKALHEEEMVARCQEIVKPGEEIFTMLSERQQRINGEWVTKKYVTFQKYIFADTPDPDDLRIRLLKVKGLTKMLTVSDKATPIYPEEEEFLKKLGGKEHVVGKSFIYHEGDMITIKDGPMANLEGIVRWTDRRQHLIGVGVKLFGTETIVKLSADFIEKE